jgi:hypothetical protein
MFMTDYPLTEQYREKIYNSLAEAVLEGLDTGQITVEDSKDSADFILLGLEAIDNLSDTLPYLEELGQKYPVYQPAIDTIKDNIYKMLFNLGIVEMKRRQDREKLGDEMWRRKVVMIRMVTIKKKSLTDVVQEYGGDVHELENWVVEDNINNAIKLKILSGEDPFQR